VWIHHGRAWEWLPGLFLPGGFFFASSLLPFFRRCP
jgi:hypothetical protein